MKRYLSFLQKLCVSDKTTEAEKSRYDTIFLRPYLVKFYINIKYFKKILKSLLIQTFKYFNFETF